MTPELVASMKKSSLFLLRFAAILVVACVCAVLVEIPESVVFGGFGLASCWLLWRYAE